MSLHFIQILILLLMCSFEKKSKERITEKEKKNNMHNDQGNCTYDFIQF